MKEAIERLLAATAAAFTVLYTLTVILVLLMVYRAIIKRILSRKKNSCSCAMCQILIAKARKASRRVTEECSLCGHVHWLLKVYSSGS